MSQKVQPWYILGTFIGTVLAGLIATYNLYKHKNAEKRASEAEIKSGFYQIEKEK